MDFNNNNNCNDVDDGFNEARRIIAEARRRQPSFGCYSFPTGTTGGTGPIGPTGATFK